MRNGPEVRVRNRIGIAILGMGMVVSGCASVSDRDVQAAYRRAAGESESVSAPAMDLSRISEQSTMDDYVRFAFRHSPRLRASLRRWQAALAGGRAAGSWGDPMLKFEQSLDEKTFLYELTLEQPISIPGKRRSERRMALAEAEVALHEFGAVKLGLYQDVIEAFQEYAYLGRATAVMEQNVQLMADLEPVVRIRYESGAVPFSELIKVQVELEKMRNDLAAMKDERPAQSRRLAAVIGASPKGVLPWPTVKPSGAMNLSDEDMEEMVRQYNPELKARDAMVERERQSEERARRNRYPDFMVGLGAMVMPGTAGTGDETEISLMAGMTLPVWQGTYGAAIRQTAALREAAVAMRSDMENRLMAELHMAIAKLKDASRRTTLYRETLIPKAQKAFEVARQEFAAGKADFMTLIDTERTLLEFRLMHERAVADREIALADVQCCVGQMQDVLQKKE